MRKRNANDVLSESGTGELRHLIDANVASGDGNKKKNSHFELTPFDAILPPSSGAYLVKGLISRAGLTVIWGPPKCGKSFWMFDLAMHIALGWLYRGRHVQFGCVCRRSKRKHPVLGWFDR